MARSKTVDRESKRRRGRDPGASLAGGLLGLRLVVAAATASLVGCGGGGPQAESARVVLLGREVASIEGRWVGSGGERRLTADGRVPAGPGSLVLVRAARGGVRRSLETIHLTLVPDRVHLVCVEGALVEAEAAFGGTQVRLAEPVVPPLPLSACTVCRRLLAGDRCRGCGATAAPLPADADLRARSILRLHAAGRADPVVFVTNPYADPLEVRITDGGVRHEFLLGARRTRIVATRPQGDLAIQAALSPGSEVVWDLASLRTPAGPALVAVGGSALLRWTWPQASGGGDAEPIPPVSCLDLSQATLVGFGLPPGSEADTPLLIGEDPDRRPARLALLAAAPLLAPLSAPLGTVVSHPDIEVAEVPTPEALRGESIRQLAVDGDRVIALWRGRAHDFRTGMPVDRHEAPLVSIAVAGGRALLLQRDAHLAGWLPSEARGGAPATRVSGGACALDPTASTFVALATAPGRKGMASHRAYVFGGRALAGLYEAGASGLVPVLVEAEAPPVSAVAEADDGLLVARGGEVVLLRDGDRDEPAHVERVPVEPAVDAPDPRSESDADLEFEPSHEPEAAGGAASAATRHAAVRVQYVLSLPHAVGEERRAEIVGLLSYGGLVVLSTRDTISVLADGQVLPLVQGIGGRLLRHPSGILLLDDASRRVFLLRGPLITTWSRP